MHLLACTYLENHPQTVQADEISHVSMESAWLGHVISVEMTSLAVAIKNCLKPFYLHLILLSFGHIYSIHVV